jgi:PAS domain S-box-containing protein
MREGVYGMDDRGRITFANPAAAGALGTTPDAMVGQRAHALFHHTRDDGSPYPLDECPIHRALRAGEGARVQHEVFWRADGQPIPVEYTVEPIRHADGTILGSVVLFTDVSAHLAAERERSALEEQLRQAQKMEAVGQLAGGVAHDFNNLLTVIGANLEFAREGLDADHPVRADLDEVEAAADRARALVRQLLLFSRRQPLQQRALRLDEVVRQAERLLRRVIGEEIVLSTALDDGGAAIRADAGQLEQLLVNLAVNARDAMLTPLHGHAGTGGTLEIATDVVTLHPSEARAWSGVAPGRWVRLRVRDTGHGMDTETREHVFEPFFTTKEVGRGTGLGLATVFGVVRQMGGGIRVDSAPGLGTTFTILLPAAAPAEATAAPAFPADAPPRAGGTVLLVEDESAVRLTARRILMRAGYVVLEARHGADALAIWQRHRGEVDAVVTDVRMPEMGGPALVARLQADRADVPVVFMSGYVDEGTRLVQGAHETFLEKPFTADGLLDAVARVTAVAAARRPDGAADR